MWEETVKRRHLALEEDHPVLHEPKAESSGANKVNSDSKASNPCRVRLHVVQW